jgi:hypothetical protein
MSETKMEENKKKLKELAVLMNRVVDNPRVTDEELDHIVGGLMSVDPHALDTAADACPR